MSLSDKIRAVIRDVPDFPKPGILFKDITPIFMHPALCSEITDAFCAAYATQKPDAILGIESRGFLFGMLMAQKLGVPFVLVRKAGKLPYRTVSETYDLEYGSATIEMHEDSLKKGWNVVIHDDLLATGGTAAAWGSPRTTVSATTAIPAMLSNRISPLGYTHVSLRKPLFISVSPYSSF